MSSQSEPALTPLRELARRISATDAAPAVDPRPLVVVVDDDLGVRQSLSSALGLQFRVLLCGSGDEGEYAVDSRASAVVLDIRMPHRDGFAVYEAIRNKLPHIPIIFYSGYQDLRDPYEVINDYKPFAYISKGSPLSALLAAVQAAVRNHEQVMRYSSISRQMQIRTLNELLALLQCDQAAFYTLDSNCLRPEAVVSSTCSINGRGGGPETVPTISWADAPVLFDGAGLRAWPISSEGFVTVKQGAYATLPVSHCSRPLGLLSAIWTHRGASVPSSVFAMAQNLAEHVGLTEAATTLQIRSLENEVKRGAARQRRLRAELHALQARVNPHFLYNTLNSIAALVHTDSDAAEQMVLELCEVFRHVLRHSESDLIPLSEELRVVRAYLQIEGKRLASRLRVAMRVDQALLGCQVPPLLLLPLVENAVAHGAAGHEAGATVTVTARAKGTCLYLIVDDTGPGVGNPMHQGRGRSISNLRRRLRLHYGDAVRLRRTRPRRGGYRVSLLLPAGLHQ
jgi:DNA-binding NarL/FixJ family response regulator